MYIARETVTVEKIVNVMIGPIMKEPPANFETFLVTVLTCSSK